MSKIVEDETTELVMQDRTARMAYLENGLRRRIGATLDAVRCAKAWSLRDLAREAETSLSQVQRLLHTSLGGSLTLRSIVNAADALGLDVEISFLPKKRRP